METYSTPALERGLKTTLLQRQIQGQAEYVNRLCFTVPSNGADEKHEWLGDVPRMTELGSAGKGPGTITALTSGGYTITNKSYRAAIRVGRDDIRRNRSGSFRIRIGQLADTALNFPNQRVTELATAGTTDLGYDGVAFFADAHPARKNEGGTQDNLLAGAGTTVANIQTDLAQVLAYFRKVKAESGEPFFGDMPLSLSFMVPAALEYNFRTALNAAIISQTSNVMVGVGDLIVNGRLDGTDANDWYAFVTNPGYRPFIWQPETGIEVDVVAEGSELWKLQSQAEFAVRQSLGAGYAFWQSAAKVVNA